MSFFFDQNYVLQNDAVLLRPLQREDAEHLLPFALNEQDLWRYSAVSAAGETGMRNYVETAVAAREQRREYPFIVFDKQTGTYAGSTRFYDISLDYNTTQLGYTWYGKQYQGTGLNKTCKLLLLTFALDTIGFDRVEFRADNNNQRSIAAMRSIGCIVEGVLRSNMPLAAGGRRDSVILSILKQEWKNGGRELLERKIKELNKVK